jgi:hypothetical protein
MSHGNAGPLHICKKQNDIVAGQILHQCIVQGSPLAPKLGHISWHNIIGWMIPNPWTASQNAISFLLLGQQAKGKCTLFWLLIYSSFN